jgi:hypothetical protein
MSMAARVYNRSSVAVRTPAQRARAHRVEALIRVAAPVLDLVLFAGEQLARVAGRNQIDPEPPRRPMGPASFRTPIGGPPERAA